MVLLVLGFMTEYIVIIYFMTWRLNQKNIYIIIRLGGDMGYKKGLSN